MTDVVVICPETDQVEHTMSRWADMLVPSVGLPNVSVTTLKGTAATQAAVQAECATNDVIVFYGHGDETALGDPMLIDGPAIAAASGRTVVAIACLSSETLGPDAVKNRGVTSYLGFTEPVFVYAARATVVGDEIAQHVGEFLKGNVSLAHAEQDLEAELKATEALYYNGAYSTQADAPLVWMGVRMNWRGLDLR